MNFIARVTSVENTSDDARTGVMFRQSNTAGSSANGFVYVTATGDVGFTTRGGTNGGTGLIDSVTGVGFPVWLRIERVSTNAVRGYYSADGFNWTELVSDANPAGPYTVNVGGGSKSIGLASSAYANGDICTSTVDSVGFGLPCPGDVNGDGVTTTGDITLVVSNLGAGAPDAQGTPGDADGDGETDTADITFVVSNLGCSS